MQLTIIAAILVAAAGVLFALQNTTSVSINLLWWSTQSPLALVLLLAVALGAVLIALLSTPATLRRQWQISRQNKRIDELERECARLRQSAPTAAGGDGVGPAVTAASETPPYVGLKEIVLRRGDHPPS